MNALNLLSLGGVAKRLNLAPTTAKRLRASGVLQPDFASDREFLFAPERLDDLENAVRIHRTPEPIL
jgi:hypothetical protein